MATFVSYMKTNIFSLPLDPTVILLFYQVICFGVAYILFTIMSFTIIYTAATQI